MGNAHDLLHAYRERRLGKTSTKPLLGYFFVLEDCPRTRAPIRASEPHFKIDPVFVSAVSPTKAVSYAGRYEVLIQRLLLEQLYDLGSLTLTTPTLPTIVTFPNRDLDATQFFAKLEGFALGAVKAGL